MAAVISTQRITLGCFLAYFVMSGMLAPMGIVSAPMAEQFGESVTAITARFSWLTMGVLVGAIIALWIFEWIPLKRLMLGVYSLIVLCLMSLRLMDGLTLIGPVFGLVGVCCGIGLPGAALLISRLYDHERRASMLVITDGAFSVSGVVCSWLAVMLIAWQWHWSSVYQFVALVALLLLGLIAFVKLPDAGAEEAHTVAADATWSPGVWLCLLALFLYTFGQWCFLLWLPNHAETALGAVREDAGQLVGQFWSGMFAAQIFVAWWVLRIGLKRLILIAALATLASSIPLWLVTDSGWLYWLVLLFGFANLGLLKIIVSFASQMLRTPTPRLISSLLLGATVGTAVSPWITSQIVGLTDSHTILQVGSASYAVLVVLIGVASRYYVAASTSD